MTGWAGMASPEAIASEAPGCGLANRREGPSNAQSAPKWPIQGFLIRVSDAASDRPRECLRYGVPATGGTRRLSPVCNLMPLRSVLPIFRSVKLSGLTFSRGSRTQINCSYWYCVVLFAILPPTRGYCGHKELQLMIGGKPDDSC